MVLEKVLEQTQVGAVVKPPRIVEKDVGSEGMKTLKIKNTGDVPVGVYVVFLDKDGKPIKKEVEE